MSMLRVELLVRGCLLQFWAAPLNYSEGSLYILEILRGGQVVINQVNISGTLCTSFDP